MLPTALLGLLVPSLAWAQQLSLNSVSSFSQSNIPDPASLALPSSNTLTISIALCSGDQTTPSPLFFVTNVSNTLDPAQDADGDAISITLTGGTGYYTGTFTNGGALAVQNLGLMSFEVGVSNSATPIHEILPDLPLLGDTTSNQAILFSANFSNVEPINPSYPNYTLPQANQSLPSLPASTPNFTLIVAPTFSPPALGSLQQTGCSLLSQNSSGVILNESLWLRDDQGWRNQWFMEGLDAQMNYTAYVVQDNTKVSGPIYFTTKSASFSCPLVSNLPYCPTVSYAVPLPAPPLPSLAYDPTNLPSTLTEPLLQIMTNFTISLLSFACGRDIYSPLMTCADCQAAYRTWLCLVSFPRCSEASPFTSSQLSETQQAPLSALVPQPTTAIPRNPNLPPPTSPYEQLLPCLEVCTAVDRACPNFLQFRCPVPRFNANVSYGVGYIDSHHGEGDGLTGVHQDQWGNVWCAGP